MCMILGLEHVQHCQRQGLKMFQPVVKWIKLPAYFCYSRTTMGPWVWLHVSSSMLSSGHVLSFTDVLENPFLYMFKYYRLGFHFIYRSSGCYPCFQYVSLHAAAMCKHLCCACPLIKCRYTFFISNSSSPNVNYQNKFLWSQFQN